MAEQQENNNPKPFHRQHYGRTKRIKAIQAAGQRPISPNGIKKEITYEQALSILMRSRQLAKEGTYHPHLITPEEKKRQIEECYKQRLAQKA